MSHLGHPSPRSKDREVEGNLLRPQRIRGSAGDKADYFLIPSNIRLAGEPLNVALEEKGLA